MENHSQKTCKCWIITISIIIFQLVINNELYGIKFAYKFPCMVYVWLSNVLSCPLSDLTRNAMKKYILISFLVFVSFTGCSGFAHAISVTCAWDQNPTDEAVAGCKVYYGKESREYDFVIDVGKNTMATITTMQDGTIYFFALRAYNIQGKRDFSEGLAVNTCTHPLSLKKIINPLGGVCQVKIITQPICDWRAESGDPSWLIIIEGENGRVPAFQTEMREVDRRFRMEIMV